MRYTLPLDEMTIDEKLKVMEQIWENLCRNPAVVPSPAWHAPILHQRESLVQQGIEQATDWRDAKKIITHHSLSPCSTPQEREDQQQEQDDGRRGQ